MPVFRLVRKGYEGFIPSHRIFIFAMLAGLVYGLGRVLYYKIFHNQQLELHFSSSMAYLLLVSPVWEEIAFRGVLLEWLRRRMRGVLPLSGGYISYANMLTAVMFAAMHLLTQPPLAAASILVPGIIFGMVYERYRIVVLCIIVHMSYNINAYIY